MILMLLIGWLLFVRVTGKNGIPCVDNQLLARTLYYELKEGEIIPSKYVNAVATVYSKLDKFKNIKEKSEFYEQLNNDALAKIYNLEKTVYRQVERRYFKNKNVCESLYEGEVNKYFSEELRIVAEDNELNFRTFHNAAYKTDEFYLETYFEKYDLDFWQMVFVSEKDKKIYVGSKNFFHLFDFSEADVALGFVKALVKARKGPSMFEVLITYNEFLRHPDVFKDFIKEPKKLTKWNFWCKEMKYKQEKFEKKFQR